MSGVCRTFTVAGALWSEVVRDGVLRMVVSLLRVCCRCGKYPSAQLEGQAACVESHRRPPAAALAQ